MIPYGRQDISEDDIRAVVDVLHSDFLTQGPVVSRFEERVAAYCGARHGIAVSNATAALHLACLALDVGLGDRVWTSPITFVASANCARYCGADVDFVDIDSRTGNISPERLAEKLEGAARAGVLPKVVIPVHLAGQSCDMQAIHALGQRYGFRIVEDASHAIGGRYLDGPVGDCRFSDIAVFSFHPVKVVTTGEGGLLSTNDDRLAARLRLLRSHGISRDQGDMTRESEGPWYYQQIALGLNYRMTDIQAALGWSQMERLDAFVAKRHVIARRYDALLEGLPLRSLEQYPDSYSGLHLYVIRIDPAATSTTRLEVFKGLRAVGIGVNVHYIPVYRQPYYEGLGFSQGYCPEAERYYEQAISLPMFPNLTEAQQDEVVTALRRELLG